MAALRASQESFRPSRASALPETVDGPAFSWRQAVLWLLIFGPVAGIVLFGVLPSFAGLRPTWIDAAIAVPLYVISGLGITVGYHRCFTHGAFRAARPLRIALALAGSLAVEGSVASWVATHRRHHAHTDVVGDPHSPWRFGSKGFSLVRGFIWAHTGWLFARQGTNIDRFAADVQKDRDLARIDRLFPRMAIVSLVLPAALGFAITRSWSGALSGFIWGGLVRIFVLHHVTWSTNSICHMVGQRPFKTADQSRNYWPLALLSFGESWHNAHHAAPAWARHGVGRGQIDGSAFVIGLFERLGWVTHVRWPCARAASGSVE